MLSNNIRAWLAVAFSAGLFFVLPGLAVSNEHENAPEQFVDGTLEIVHIDEIDQSQSRFAYYLLTDGADSPGNSGAAFELKFQRQAPASLKTGDRLNVRGRAVGRNLWVEDIAAADQDGSTATPDETLAESAPDSPRSAVIILVNINGTTADWTNSHVDTVNQVMYTNNLSVDNLYAEASFNQTGFPSNAGTVVAPVTVDKIDGCPVYSYAAAADAAAQSQRDVDVSNYQHRIYIMANGSAGCNWLALGVVGNYGSTGTLRSWSSIIDASAIAHEVGHNVGWHHAATDTNNNGYNASESTDVEYGDTSGTMGYCCTEKKFNAVHMDQIGWYDNTPAGTMLTVGGAGNYTLVPLGSDPVTNPGPQILKVNKPDTGEVYYLSYRQKVGGDINIPSSFTTGVNIHHGSETGIWSYFIRALSDLQNFDDPVNGLTIAQNWHDASGVNIDIAYDSCLPANPSVSVSPATQTVNPTATPSASYDVTVSNNDSAGCDPATFELTSDKGDVLPSNVLVSPAASSGQLGFTLEVAGLSEGPNGFLVTATRGVNSGAASGTLTIDSLPPTIPGNPAAVQKKVKGQQSIEVSWSASSDAGTGVSYYRVSRDGSPIGTTSSLKFADTNGTLNEVHVYEIEAVDGFNHVSAPATANFNPGDSSSGPGNGGGNGRGKPKK
jgi:hypothetical protein